MPEKIQSLKDLYFADDMQDVCKDTLTEILNKFNVYAKASVEELSNGDIHILAFVQDMDLNTFWDEDTQVMKIFSPDLAEQLERIRQIRETRFILEKQKNMPVKLSGIKLSDFPVLHEMTIDYYHFMGKPTPSFPEWKSDVQFGMEINYDPNPRQGTPFRVASSCAILCKQEIISSLKYFMNIGMDRQTAISIKNEFDRFITPAREYLVNGEPPEILSEFQERMSDGLTSTWFITSQGGENRPANQEQATSIFSPTL